VFRNQSAKYLVFPLDSLVKHQPEVVLAPPPVRDALGRRMMAMPGLRNSPAIQRKRVGGFQAGNYTFGGPQTIYAVIELTDILHPEVPVEAIFRKFFQDTKQDLRIETERISPAQ
jgi:ABC-type hemin transport system substrate-binding protein